MDTSICDSPRAQGIPTEAQHGAGKREEGREQRDRTNGGEERETTRQTHKKTKGSDRGKERNRHAQRRRRSKYTDVHTTEGGNVPRISPPHANAQPAISSRGKRGRRGEERVQINPRQKHYRRITEGQRKRIPHHSERTGYTGTI